MRDRPGRPALGTTAGTDTPWKGTNVVNVLRGIAYVLTSLASLLFIVVVIYGYVQINAFAGQVQNVFPGAGAAGPSFTEPAPPADATGEEMFCFSNPDDPLCP